MIELNIWDLSFFAWVHGTVPTAFVLALSLVMMFAEQFVYADHYLLTVIMQAVDALRRYESLTYAR